MATGQSSTVLPNFTIEPTPNYSFSQLLCAPPVGPFQATSGQAFNICQFDTRNRGQLKMQVIFIFVACFSRKSMALDIHHFFAFNVFEDFQLNHSFIRVFWGRLMDRPSGGLGASSWRDGIPQVKFLKLLEKGGKKRHFSQVGGIPSWNQGLELGFKDNKNHDFCRLWQ